MKIKFKHSAGFTLVEMVIAMVLGGIIVAGVLVLTLSSQRLSNAIVEQIHVQDHGRKVAEMISRDIRGGERVEIYSAYPGSATASTGNYLKIFFPSDQSLDNVGYYYSAGDIGEIRKVTNLATDIIASTADDKSIAVGVTSTNMFTAVSALLVEINFRVINVEGDESETQSFDLTTQVALRN